VHIRRAGKVPGRVNVFRDMTALTSRTRRSSIALAAAAALAITVATPAVAGGGSTVVKAGHAAGTPVVVSSHGRTLYVLTPETTKHLLCTGSCLSVWLPVKTGKSTKLKAGNGVKGRLGRFSRGGGSYQVTLRGLPVYTYVGDSGSGTASGIGLTTNGGTWHILRPAG